MDNRSMPKGAVIPVLAYPDLEKAIEWLCDRFNFTLRIKIGNHRAQLNVFESNIVITERKNFNISESSNHSIMIRISDVNSHYERSIALGIKVIEKPADFPFGEKQYSVEDFAGHKWTFSETISDEIPESWGGVSYNL